MKRILIKDFNGMRIITLQQRVLWLWWFDIDEAAFDESLSAFTRSVKGEGLPVVNRALQET